MSSSQDPAPVASPATPAAPAKAKEAPAEWKAKKGAACTAVYMKGGPVFVKTAGKILSIDDDGLAVVEYLNERGKPARLEGVPMESPSAVFSRACYTEPS